MAMHPDAKKLRAVFALAAAMLLLTSCASMWTRFEPFSSQRLAPKPQSLVLPMSPGEPINRRYEKLGVVWSSWYTYQSAEEHVREKAKEIGADAVINLRYTTYEVTVNYAMGSFYAAGATTTGSVVSTGYTDGYPKVVGLAIRFTDESQEEVRFTNPNIVDPQSAK